MATRSKQARPSGHIPDSIDNESPLKVLNPGDFQTSSREVINGDDSQIPPPTRAEVLRKIEDDILDALILKKANQLALLQAENDRTTAKIAALQSDTSADDTSTKNRCFSLQ